MPATHLLQASNAGRSLPCAVLQTLAASRCSSLGILAGFSRPVRREPSHPPHKSGHKTLHRPCCRPGQYLRAAAMSSLFHEVEEQQAEAMELQLKVGGMVCENCTAQVCEMLEADDDVQSASADLESGITTVIVHTTDQYETAFRTLPALVQLVKDGGFEAEAYFEGEELPDDFDEQ